MNYDYPFYIPTFVFFPVPMCTTAIVIPDIRFLARSHKISDDINKQFIIMVKVLIGSSQPDLFSAGCFLVKTNKQTKCVLVTC